MTKCWEEKPQERPTFQWLCSTVKKLLHDRKVCSYFQVAFINFRLHLCYYSVKKERNFKSREYVLLNSKLCGFEN